MVSTRSANKSPTAAAAAAAASPSGATAAKRSAPASKASPAAKKQAVGGSGDLAVGATASADVTLVDQSGASVRFLDTFQERGVVFFMYPKANTPGCTKQACGALADQIVCYS